MAKEKGEIKMERYLVYCVEKEYNEKGVAECGLYRVIEVWDSGNDKIENERKAIEKWVEFYDLDLEIELEDEVYGNPVWSAKDGAEDDKPYYIVLQHLPKSIKN